ncbi:YfiR family protein [Azospirillum sp. ST 5-10]|uniref:YfiR family protein n=1 Tax=unclassified Azospirillum TaxID=2630922 RepID=UPI003F4A1A8E
MPRRRRLRTRLCILLGLAPALAGATMADADSLELAVKATYLYKFAPFVAWPEAALGGPDAPIAVCIVGPDPFGSVIDRAVAGQRLGERPFVVRRPASAAAADGCHVAFVGHRDPGAVAAALRGLRGRPVLTVTDRQGAREAKGIVNFVIVDGRVRFEIDGRTAAENGIAISSKLLSLAVPGQDGE